MIKFNLERALAGDKLITRGGYAVTGFCARPRKSVFKFCANVNGTDRGYTEEGRWGDKPSQFDLFMAEEAFAPKAGDVVEVSMDGVVWKVRTFLFTFEGKHWCILHHGERPPAKIASGEEMTYWPNIIEHVGKHTVKVIIDGVVRMDEEMTQKELDEKFIL